MSHQHEDLDLRVARLEEEMEALERKVEALREEFRSFAHLVDRTEIARPEPV
jgi:chaperonin cofactor prefoldin